MKKTNELSSRQMKEVKGGRHEQILGPGDQRFHIDDPLGYGSDSGNGQARFCHEVIFQKQVVGHPEMRCADNLICRQLWGPDAYCSDGLKDYIPMP